MSDIITIERSDLRNFATVFAQEILKEMGVKPKNVNQEWISKNQALKLAQKKIGRKKLDTAIAKGIVRKKPGKNNGNPRSPIPVNKKDVERLIQNPYLV